MSVSSGQASREGRGLEGRPAGELVRRVGRRLARIRGARQRARATGLILAGAGVLWLLSCWPAEMSWALYAPLVVLAGLFLTPGWFLLTCLTYAAGLVYSATMVRGWSTIQGMTLLALVLTMAVMVRSSRSRERLGVHGNDGEDMLVDLRDRLLALGNFPDLPAGWHGESAIEAAYGDKFSGDFAVTSLSPDRSRLEVALIDISGKGRQAGTRSLLFSGAIGGLLGQVEPERFMTSANHYVLRQGWTEGFASAVHLSLDLMTGEFTIGNAGHPAVLHFAAGSGLWSVHESLGGPVLGIIPGADFPRHVGVLRRGDALVLYTDGVIETRDRDLARGVDRLLGSAERRVPIGFAGGAQALCAEATSGDTDDRAVIVIWRC
ncbi:MAG: serine/threonine-protein phosphatase [Actinomycetales bacterium]|nr:serine/threonine-protein phosphatase [Actinomycetales bacterium]